MSKFLINISRGYKMHDYYDFAYNDLYNKHNIKTILFFDRNLSKKEVDIDLITKWYEIVFYDSKSDLIIKIKDIKREEIYYINTFEEILIPLVHDIRIELWFEVSKEFKAFRNKHIQRDILKNTFPETTVKNIEVNIENDNLEDYYNKLDFPYIIKPSSWVQSSGVMLIENKNDLINYINNIKFLNHNMKSRWIENELFLIEEFIDGEMYTIVYFVDDFWNVSYTPIVKVNSARKIWIDDFSNYVRINWKIVDKEIEFSEVDLFVKKHVEAFWIRNTFIFHDFKINSKWELKNIELNARIWWYRLEIMQNTYGFNLLEMPLWNSWNFDTDYSYAVFVFYPWKNWVLKWFNSELVEQFKKLNSYIHLRLSNYLIWQNVWLTKDWFWSISALKIKNNNLEQFKNDYKFIEDNYNNLIILE